MRNDLKLKKLLVYVFKKTPLTVSPNFPAHVGPMSPIKAAHQLYRPALFPPRGVHWDSTLFLQVNNLHG